MFDEAWVTYSDGGYFGVMDGLLHSLREFSSRPVLVYGVRDDFNATGHPNVAEVTRIDSPEHIWTLKLDAMIGATAKAKRLIFLDADMVANHGVDQLWAHFAGQQGRPELPMLPDHPPLRDCPVALRWKQIMGESLDRDWGCTCLIWYTAACSRALAEARALKRQAEAICPEVGDGEAINAMLERHGVMTNAPFCTPLYTFADHYLRTETPPAEVLPGVRQVSYHFFHGVKTAEESAQLLAKLRGASLPLHYHW